LAIDGFGGIKRLATCLAICLIGGTGDVQRDGRGDFRMEADGDLGDADGLDRSLQLDLAAADLEAGFVENLGDVASGYRTVKLAGLGSGADDDEALAVQLLGNGFGFLLALEVARFQLDAL